MSQIDRLRKRGSEDQHSNEGEEADSGEALLPLVLVQRVALRPLAAKATANRMRIERGVVGGNVPR